MSLLSPRRIRLVPCLLVLVTLVVATPCPARADDLVQQLRDLQRTVAQLEERNSNTSLTEQRATEIRALVREVLTDADQRASLLDDGAITGYDGGFFISRADGSFSLNISGQIQARYILNLRDGAAVDGTRSGFGMRRTKLSFDGHVVNKSWKYKIKGSFDRDGGVLDLQSAWIRKKLNDEWTIRGGQFKPAFQREEGVSSKYQLLAERSIIDRRFRISYSEGVEVEFENEWLRLTASFNDGLRNSNSPALMRDVEYAFTGRAEWLARGDWGQFKDFSGWPDSDPGLLIGAAVHYEQEELGTTHFEEEIIRATVDASLELAGASAFAAFIYSDTDGPRDEQWGVVAQAGLFVSDNAEVFARYEYGDGGPTAENTSLVTVGFNRYFAGHDLKLTIDAGYAFDEVDSFWDSDAAGWLEDAPGEDGQFVLRTQLQLLF